jgi:hypothetical protein
MNPVTEIAGGIYGAWRLARRDPAGLGWFDASERGFWHSFWAAALLLPAFLTMLVLDGVFQDGVARPLVVQLIAYVLRWTAFPLAMAHIAVNLDRGQHYIRYIVAYNWSSVIQMALFLPIAVLGHLFPGGGFAMLNLMVVVVLLAYQAYVAHVCLEVGLGTAVGVVMLDLALDGLIEITADRLIG